MRPRRIPAADVEPQTVPEGPWADTNLFEVFPTTGDTRMSCGVHEILAGEITVESAPVDDVLYILEGEMEITAGGVTETYRAGDFAYLYAGERQVFRIPERVKHIYVTYPRSWQ